MIVGALLLLFGCTVTREETIKTGLFGDNLRAMLEAYDQTKEGQTKEFIDKLGFHFDAPNVKEYGGAEAIQLVFKDNNVFQGALADVLKNPEKKSEVLKLWSPYKLYLFPYRYVVTVKDRFYLNTQETTIDGHDARIMFVFDENDQLVYRPKYYVKIQERYRESAFLKGILDILGMAATTKDNFDKVNPTDRIKDALDKDKK